MVSAIDSKTEPSKVRGFISLSDVEINSKNNGALGFLIGPSVYYQKHFCFLDSALKTRVSKCFVIFVLNSLPDVKCNSKNDGDVLICLQNCFRAENIIQND